ncbi:hypothetical protein LCGC14_1906870 [marine sediment metagenome]|uniref:Small integral membrane protein n=1 Tax=marine sediment metagenome TaxID=412755 RepID=A0A0F9FUU7_9ZZZZ
MTCSEKDYGEHYKPHLLEQYKLYVEMADRISARRQTANSFFLSVNTAIIALVGYINFGSKTKASFYWLVSLAGMLLCFIWYRLVRSYKDLNSAKFKVVNEIEKELPIAPYDREWEKVGRGKDPKLYLPFTHIEIFVPWVFFAIHVVVFLEAVRVLEFLRELLWQIYLFLGQL